MLVLSSHLQLQKEGFLSTWANSLVGPLDPYHYIRVCTILMRKLSSGFFFLGVIHQF
ncbi:hypothetical protein I3760_14G137400 [Carya illinoinensis]|nr:hypothetical protein I3760_14G137400 [Carya illinoinensis]